MNINDTKMVAIRIDPDLYYDFVTVCKAQDITISQVLRAAIRDYVSAYKKAIAVKPKKQGASK